MNWLLLSNGKYQVSERRPSVWILFDNFTRHYSLDHFLARYTSFENALCGMQTPVNFPFPAKLPNGRYAQLRNSLLRCKWLSNKRNQEADGYRRCEGKRWVVLAQPIDGGGDKPRDRGCEQHQEQLVEIEIEEARRK